MRTFKFFNGTIDGLFTPYHQLLYENSYRWEIQGFEFVGVTLIHLDLLSLDPPSRKRVYRDTTTDELITGDIITEGHSMFHHPNVIDL